MYLDNGATTYPKPPSVIRAVNQAMQTGANPGRSGHRLSLKAGELVYRCREEVARLFSFDKPENVMFTPNCTASLNIVMQGLLKSGDHVVISSLEHNAVVRPLEALKKRGVSYTVAQAVEGDDEATIRRFRNAFRQNTRLCVCTHASNVFGVRLPAERLAALCHLNGILFCLDAAQSAGVLPIALTGSSIDYLCAAGHKGLYGPMGTGILVINSDTVPDSLIQGGTGSFSSDRRQPEVLPDRFESGTPNLPGIAGLGEGVRFVLRRGTAAIFRHEMALCQQLYRSLEKTEGVTLYTAYPQPRTHAPVLSFNIDGMDSEQVAEILSRQYGIAVRAGLHCAPLAHETYGTEESGTVRVVPSVFTQPRQIQLFSEIVKKISKLDRKKVANL